MQSILTMACLLLAGTLCFADAWEFFYPATVTSFGCTARQAEILAHGEKRGRGIWQAEAHATRSSKEGDWSMTLGEYSANDKGRHEAEKACSRWMDQASKRVKAAR